MKKLIGIMSFLCDRSYPTSILLGMMLLWANISHAQKQDTVIFPTIGLQNTGEEIQYDPAMVGIRFDHLSKMAKNIDASTDKYTGVVQVEIPLYEMQTGAGKLPVSLTYRTTGIRVDDIASEAGLGWELSAGGRITRNVRGQVDKKVDLLYAEQNAENDIEDYGKRSLRDGWDSQPDIYYFEYPGGSGSFVFDLQWKPRTIPFQNTKIECQNDVFIIYDSNGTKYIYQTSEQTEMNDKKYISTWFLDRIEFINGTSVTYEYETGKDYKIKNWNFLKDFLVFNLENPTYISYYGGYAAKTQFRRSPKYLKSIKYFEQEIGFVYDTLRTDWTELRRLTEVVIYVNKKKYSTYKLNFGTFPDKTPKLLSINEQPHQGIIRPICSFNYYEDVYLPVRKWDFNGFDHWGFFNTDTNNQYNYPDLRLCIPNLSDSKAQGASRKPNLHFTRSQTLKKISYPNGGSKEFIYELHHGVNRKTNIQEDAGGLRIKQIVERDDKTSTPRITSFEYIDGIIYDDAFNYVAEYGKCNLEVRLKVSSKCISMPVDYFGCSVVYSTVEETLPNGSRIKYDYVPLTLYPDLEPETFMSENPYRIMDFKMGSPKTSRAWGRNILQSKEWYSDKKCEKIETYQYLIDTSKAVKIPSRYVYADGHYLFNDSQYPSTYYYFIDKSFMISCPVVISKKEVIGNTTTLPSQTHYICNENYLPVTIFNVDCERNRTTTFFLYPDIKSTNPSLRRMAERNANIPIEKITYRNGKVLDAELSSYKINSANPNSIVPDQKINYRYKQLIDSTELRFSRLLSDQVEYDLTKYHTVMVYDEFDDRGNLLCYHEPNGIYHSILYNDTQSSPIAYVENARHSIRTDGKYNQVFFKNFETDGIDYPKAKSGYKVGSNMMSYVIDLSYFLPGTYVLSYWYKSSDVSAWKRYQEEVNVSSASSMYYVPMVSGALYIDDLSLIPKNAVITSEYTIVPLGKISETDAQGKSTYYEYNKAGLPSRVYDNERTLIQQISYDNHGVDL